MDSDHPAKPPGEGKPSVTRKRNRTPASCGHCRIRKLKCSRTHPCDACVKTGDASTCSYVSQEAINSRQAGNLHFEESQSDALTARIDRLEALLLSAMRDSTQASQGTPTKVASGYTPPIITVPTDRNDRTQNTDSKTEQVVEKFGVMHVDANQNRTSYLGGSHWVSIMCEIDEFKSYLQTNAADIEHKAFQHRVASSKLPPNCASLLRGTDPPVSREYLLSYVPPKAITDKLVTLFLHTHSSAFHIIHEPTFQKEYDEYWRDPTGTSTMWLGLLFAMLHLAEVVINATGNASTSQMEPQQVTGQYKSLLIQCLIAGDYTNNPTILTIQTLILYIEAEWVTSQDTRIEAPLVLGLAIRLAMGMGLHRDSRSHPGITVFQGEIRRRLWAQIHQMDILQSFWSSLPTTIYQRDCDCALPRNIFDAEFGEDTGELPPSRAPTEATEISYTVAKLRLVLALGRVVRFTQSQSELDYASILKHDNELNEAKRLTPPHLRIDTVEIMNTYPPNQIQQRIGLDRVYHVGKCLLYRKFLPLARRDTSLMQYRDSCIEAAMTLLNHQATMILDLDLSYPQNIRERHMNTLTTHDFFIAGMAIVLDLHYGLEIGPATPASQGATSWGQDRRNEMIAMLETSIEFWRIVKDVSVEAAKAYAIFSFALMKAKEALITSELGTRASKGVDEIVEITRQPEDFVADQRMNREGTIPLPEFDWDLWNSHNIDGLDFESLFQWPSSTSESYEMTNFT